MIRQDWSTLKKLTFAKTAAGGAAAVEYTATGNPLTFLTDLARPLKSLLIPFTPQQTGSGDPSPVNIRPIVPWEGLTVEHGGKNLYDKTQGKEGFVWWEGNELYGYGNYKSSVKIPVVPNGKYTLSKEETGQNQIQYFDKNGDYLRQDTGTLGYLVSRFTVPADVYFIAFNIENTALDTAQLEAGETATSYEPYKPVTETDISFASPVYGGTLDAVTGVLTVEWALFTAKWKNGTNASDRGNNVRKQFAMPVSFVDASETITAYCDAARWRWNFESDDVHFFAHRSTSYVFLPEDTDGEFEFHIVGKLATPVEIQLTPAQITALLGDNTIWSDADGSMTAIYLKKG